MKRAGTFTTGLKLSKVKLVEDERQIFYKVEVLVSSVVFKMMTFCQLAFQNFHYPLTVINELRIKNNKLFLGILFKIMQKITQALHLFFISRVCLKHICFIVFAIKLLISNTFRYIVLQ